MSTFNNTGEAFKINAWLNTGIIAGAIACIVYPLAIFVPITNHQFTLIVGASFGPALAIASIALGKILLEQNWSSPTLRLYLTVKCVMLGDSAILNEQ